MNIEVENTRIAKLRMYLFNIIDSILKDNRYQINANMLSDDINNYSLDKIPVKSKVEKWTIGIEIHKDVYLFRSRLGYSQDAIDNLANVGFFETFENIIYSNNKKGILPDISGIETVECLDCGSMQDANTNSCEFGIQLQITYRIGAL